MALRALAASQHCCAVCALRLQGCREVASYQQVLGSSGSEENARESCGLCLGVLRAWQEPLRALLSEEPKLEGEYLLSIDLPVVGALREQILLSLAEEEATVVELKDLLQWLIQDELGSRGFVQAKEPLKADVFTIHAAGDYSGNGTEILQSLQTPRSGTSRPSKKRRREEPPAALTASAVTKALSGLSKDELKTKLGLGDLSEGLQRPSAPASLRLQICRSEGFFIRGRYLKLSRRLPQSPWVIEGERKGDGSVEEDIATPVAKYFGASEVRFHAEGREDIDVRMLGPGRPFVLEVKNARNLSVKLAEVQSAVNAAGDRVEISELRECQARMRAVLRVSSCFGPTAWLRTSWGPASMRPDGPDGGAGACDVLFVGNQELYEIFLLDRANATVAGYHIVQARKLLGKFPKLSKYSNASGSGRFLLTLEEIFFGSSGCRPLSSCEAAASAEVWCKVLDSVKAPELPLEVVEERMQALQQRLLRFATTGDPSAATLIMVETSNLLDFLGLRHHPASSSLRSCVGELSKRPQGRMVALADAVKVVAGLRQFIEALYGDPNRAEPTIQTLTFGHKFNQSLERVTLPSSLQTLTFGHKFIQSLERVTMPSSLQILTFGIGFNQSLEGVILPSRVILPSSLQTLTFGHKFNQSLERVTLPSSLQTLTFGHEFNQSLERVTLPSSLQTLTFGHKFNQSLERVTLPSSLQTLTFGHKFNQSLERVTLPSSLQTLTFGHKFSQSLERVILPSSLQTLTLGGEIYLGMKGVTVPSSLQTLTFGPGFNQSLERVTLPSSLQTLTFGFECNQSLKRVTLPSSLQTLTFGHKFNQSLERVTLPSSLQTLTFGHDFNQSLERVTLPSSLQTLTFDEAFNQSLERVTLPSSLQTLTFGFEFNQSLERVTLPSSLQTLTFGYKFIQSLERVTMPSSLQTLTFGFEFNQSLERVTLPSSLQTLTFGHAFNQSLERVILPSSLQTLTFGHEFNQSLERVTLPSSLQTLTFGHDFNQSLERVTLPSSLQTLTFGFEFNQSLERVTLPSSLQTLTFGHAFNQSLERVILPSSLQTLTFGHNFSQSLERVTLPSSLQTLTFGHEFNQSLERVTLPNSVQTLTFGRKFNQILERVTLPSSLQTLTFGNAFNQSLAGVTLQSSLESFGLRSDQLLMEALGCAGGMRWQGRCDEILERREWSPENYLEEEDETVQRARAWLNSRGLCDTSPLPAAEQEEVPSKSPGVLRDTQPPRRARGLSARRARPSSWAAEVRRQEAMSDRLKAKASAENMPLPCPEAVRRAQQRAKKIQLKQAEEEALKLEQRLYHGQLVAAKTAELFRERDQRRVRSARSVSRERKDLTKRSLLDSHRERPRGCAPAPEPCPGQ
eukprot:s539_g2.t1